MRSRAPNELRSLNRLEGPSEHVRAAAFRVLYPEADRVPFRKLLRRVQQEGILSANIADLAETAVELRNLFSHPATQTALTVGMAAPMLENTHRLVDLVIAGAAFRANEPQERAQLKVTVSSAIRSSLQRRIIVPVLPLSQANQSSSTSPEETPLVTVRVSEGGWVE